MPFDEDLPPDIREGATLRGHECGWSVSSFPNALAKAEARGYACLGGQFQFRLNDGTTCEMYWLNADSADRMDGESWSDYSRRSCTEVLQKFQHLISHTDLGKESSSWPDVQIDPIQSLVFVAYFLTETDWASLAKNSSKTK
jgi:hypothetical protein